MTTTTTTEQRLQAVKDEVAKENGFANWNTVWQHFRTYKGFTQLEDDVIRLHASREYERRIAEAGKELPRHEDIVNESVLFYTASDNREDSLRRIGFYDGAIYLKNIASSIVASIHSQLDLCAENKQQAEAETFKDDLISFIEKGSIPDNILKKVIINKIKSYSPKRKIENGMKMKYYRVLNKCDECLGELDENGRCWCYDGARQ